MEVAGVGAITIDPESVSIEDRLTELAVEIMYIPDSESECGGDGDRGP
jgi:hypothetical protein